jgi:Flp pilus assembly protein TadG
VKGEQAGPRGRPRSRGQALVEFALVFPVFMAILLGLVDGARLTFAQNTVSQSAREAVRLAAVQAAFIAPATCTAPVCPANTAAFRTNVVEAANRMSVLVGQVTSAGTFITCTSAGSAPTGAWTGGNNCASGNISGNVVSVRIVATIRPITPVFAIPFPQIDLASSATMMIP